MKKDEFAQKAHYDFADLTELVDFLRSENGCPWDRVQSHESIRNRLPEEAYEVCEGIDRKNDTLLTEELGDVLFQVLFHTSIAQGQGRFSMQDVIDGICRKMIRRHPHLFSNEENIPDWEEIKKQEKGETCLKETLLRISPALPALMRAEKFVSKGKDALPEGKNSTPMEKIGKELFDTVKESTRLGIEPEEALSRYLSGLIDSREKE